MRHLDRDRIKDAIKNTLGADIINLLNDESVIEIMRNDSGALCAEWLGQEIEELPFSINDSSVASIIRFLASSNNDVCNESKPSLAVKLPFWQARFQGLLPPIVRAPSFTIRKHSNKIYSLEDYLSKAEINECQYKTLERAILERKNIVISGGTGSGKTTLANAILQKMVDGGDRIITVEDTPELRLCSRKGQQLFTRDEISYDSRKALKDILRLRPDRIILGELRDGACLDLIKAWNTGHAGGLTTVHANSCSLALKRLESLILEVSIAVPKELIAQTVNIIVQVEKKGSKRCVVEVIVYLAM